MKIKYGYHASSYPKLTNTLINFIDEDRCKILQIYCGNKLSKDKKQYDIEDIETSRELIKKFNLNLYIHANLSLSLTNNNYFNNYTKQILTSNLELLDLVGGLGVVVHPGSYKDIGHEEGMNNLINNLKTLLKENKDKKSKIILENSAGEGNKIMSNLIEMEYIYNKLKKYFDEERIAFCIDTCHLFSNGEFDINKEEEIIRFEKEWKEKIGKSNLELIHLNDSKKEFGCKVDRHESLGKGKIWNRDNLKLFCQKFRFINMLAEEDIKRDFESYDYIKRLFDI